MKEYFILFLITLFSFSLSSSYDIHILTKGNTEEFTSRDGTFVFDVSSFSLNDEIAIVVHATSFINSKAIAEFFDSMDDYDENGKDNAFQIDSFKTVGETSSTTNYYKIQKSNDFLESLNGNYLFLLFQCNGVVTFKLNKELENSNTNSEYLKKHGSIDVNGSNGGIIMDTKDFNIGDEIYLIINATKFINNKIYYEFVDDLENYTPKSYYEDYDSVEPSKSKYENGKQIKYYTIRKNYGQLSNNIKGNFLIIYFECTGKVTIKNTVENQGKLSTGAIVAIVIVLLIIIVGAIACYCYRTKKSAQIQPWNHWRKSCCG